MLRTCLPPTDAHPLLDALDAWTPAQGPASTVHSGDLGWFLRFEADEIGDGMVAWSDGAVRAVALLDGPVLRLAHAPDLTDVQGEALADDVADMTAGREAWCDVPPAGPLRDALRSRGFADEPDDPWPVLVRNLSGPTPSADVSTGPVAEADAPDRVAVQRSAFDGSTFTVERWRRLVASPAGGRMVEALVRAGGGVPAAAATGWFAGPGRCALLEPVATHPDQRGAGHGRAVVDAVCAGLAARGASAVAVVTPASNVAAVALYRSAGFEPRWTHLTLHRPA